jgi:SAM-dependent methyltransferase
MALPLIDYLGPTGRYDGFDIAGRAVEWCRREITPRHPNFRFFHADVFNAFYQPTGRTRSRCWRFPFPSSSFDFVFLTSVFTHMLPADLENYLAEVSRVLCVGGRCFATFLLLNDDATACLRTGRSPFRLPYTHGRRGEHPTGRPAAYGDCLTETRDGPEQAVAYEERWVFDQFRRCGLALTQAPSYGSWPGRERATDFQDIVVATKERGISASFRLRRGLRAYPVREGLWRLKRFAGRLLRAA